MARSVLIQGARRVGAGVALDRESMGLRRKREAYALMLAGEPEVLERWCCQCGWHIPTDKGYRRRGYMQLVPGQEGLKSDCICWWCPRTGGLDVAGGLRSLSERDIHLAREWAKQFQTRTLSGVDVKSLLRGEHRDVRARLPEMVRSGVLREPRLLHYNMPYIYVAALTGGGI